MTNESFYTSRKKYLPFFFFLQLAIQILFMLSIKTVADYVRNM